MGLALRPVVLACLLAVAGVATAVVPHSMGDYVIFVGSVHHLLDGDLTGATGAGPVYAASLLLRLPAAALAHGLGGGDFAVYRAGAVMCMLGVAAFAWVVAGAMAVRQRTPAERLAATALLMGAVALLSAVRFGHPEEALGGALCAGAVLAAVARRPALAGLLLGLAIANKPWGVIAVVPVLLGAPAQRGRLALTAGATATALIAPFWLLAHHAGTAGAGTAELVAGGHIWRPQQLFFLLGHEVHHTTGGVTYTNYRGPLWYSGLAHPLAVALTPLLGALAWRRERATGVPVGLDALGLLGVALLLRCALDPWNITYYVVPAVLALVAWEALTRPGLPVLGALTAVGTWLSFTGASRLGIEAATSLRFWLYVVFVVPVLAEALRRLYGNPAAVALGRRVGQLRPV